MGHDLAQELALDRIRRRLSELRPEPAPSAPRAAVAAILTDVGAGPEVLLIRRAEHAHDPWSGHMAFPGGRHEPDDRSLEQTAVRETREEIGVDLPELGELLGRLDDVPTHKTGLVVRPFVWLVPDRLSLAPNEEVQSVHWVTLGSLLSGERDAHYDLEWEGNMHRFPGFAVDDAVVWGLTYRMLQIFFAALRG